ADAMGLHINVLWLVGLGGIAALAGAVDAKNGRALSAVAGALVLGSMGLYIGSALVLVFAWGAWITLGASATALVVAASAPNPPLPRGTNTVSIGTPPTSATTVGYSIGSGQRSRASTCVSLRSPA